MKNFIAYYNGRELKVKQISASAAIQTAAKIFGVKMNKVSVREVRGSK
jgi:hypothetical protein